MRGREDPAEAAAESEHQLWGGRFTGGLDDAARMLNRSLPVDHRLWPQDVRVARAWVGALAASGLLTPDEAATLAQGLAWVEQRLADGAAFGAPDEDVHTLVERLLYERIGSLAGKLNTGRSRNDQVATDLRLWCLEAARQVDHDLRALGAGLVRQASRGVDLVLPGYTHGQRAQPIRWAFVMLAHAWPIVRDLERLDDAAHRARQLPLGSGALAGSGVPVDRSALCRELGFAEIAPNALDATGDRDFVIEFVAALALAATHVSRLAAELIAYASAEFGFIRLGDAFCTGSSLLPQKRNPDILELARARAARLDGDLTTLLVLLKGLPAGYSKDLQEDKRALFDAVDAVLEVLPAVSGAVESLEPVPDRMRAALDQALFATDLADSLVRRGLPFREAHEVVGRLVRLADERGIDLTAVPANVAVTLHRDLPGLLATLGDWERSIESRRTAGGSSKGAVQEQLAALRAAFTPPDS